MIACGNKDCSYQWFHLTCVGLEQFRSKWYCRICEGRGPIRTVDGVDSNPYSDLVPSSVAFTLVMALHEEKREAPAIFTRSIAMWV